MLTSHTSNKDRFSENVDKKPVTYLMFFVGKFWFQKWIIEEIPWAPSEVTKVKGGRLVKDQDFEAKKFK